MSMKRQHISPLYVVCTHSSLHTSKRRRFAYLACAEKKTVYVGRWLLSGFVENLLEYLAIYTIYLL